ncbi:PAS domain-containing sensor histidine kinase [Geovibrio thiophilus]|uniref:histidine kinase n=1 Tax=Geovibrio thiophilus TaxID=139438 RepID=A0A410K0P0_9BACT|nr:PAS domain-containing sensor histidine kinase [Geovibrio thiophilus]QAR33990.1 PAS domain-containing sensor histidine kinase [Geovibrio thiophilus]
MFIKADLHRVFDGVPVAVHSINPEGVFEYVNAKWLNLFGYMESEVLGRHFADLLHSDYKTKAIKKFREFAEKGELEELQMKFIKKDGGELKISIQSFAVYDDNGSFVRSYAFLEPCRVQPERADEYPAPSSADVKNEFVNELLAAISHHWRQPLNALGLNIQNLSESFSSSEHEEMFKEFETLSMSIILEMSETIDSFKDFFKVHEEGWFTLAKAVEQTLCMYDSLLNESGITVCVTCNCEEGQTTFTADHKPLCGGFCKLAAGSEINFKQVMMHLLSNAVNAIRRSGQIRGRIAINIANYKNRKTVEITNNGGGISEDILERIFEPYFTTSEVGQNKGLGLYLAKTLVEKSLNGSLICSAEKSTTTFTIVM